MQEVVTKNRMSLLEADKGVFLEDCGRQAKESGWGGLFPLIPDLTRRLIAISEVK
ncbi:MAG: hypothetical protein PHU23_07685 [Dehalococcoidales bacterium]|nr:hypothetical protein [Dehalococcoidales bacterium]